MATTNAGQYAIEAQGLGPYAVLEPEGPPRKWSSSLFSCFEPFDTCKSSCTVLYLLPEVEEIARRAFADVWGFSSSPIRRFRNNLLPLHYLWQDTLPFAK